MNELIFTIGIVGIGISTCLVGIIHHLKIIGIALKGIELHSAGILGTSVRIHQALNRVVK